MRLGNRAGLAGSWMRWPCSIKRVWICERLVWASLPTSSTSLRQSNGCQRVSASRAFSSPRTVITTSLPCSQAASQSARNTWYWSNRSATFSASWRLRRSVSLPSRNRANGVNASSCPTSSGNNRFRRQLEQWLEDALAAGLDHRPLPLNIVKDVLLQGLDEGGLNQRFLAGKVNFATLMPMRAIPFRKVCLLGMNDGDYPRSRPPVDFDLMAQDYRPGDRSRREDDRYLFLEALLSAREQLYISWVGRSIKDDSERPPSVLIGQLQDHLDSLWAVAGQTDSSVTQALTTQHPLQPFSRDYFPKANGLGEGEEAQPKPLAEVLQARGLFTYEREWRSAHGVEALEQAHQALPYQAPEEPISLNELANFLKKPIDNFYQRRLQVRFEDVEDEDTDNENFDLNGLDRWRLDNELIQT